MSEEKPYDISGNTLGNHFSLTKIKWIKELQSQLYKEVDYFLPWTSFISFMLGADPVVDYSLANCTLIFNINQKTWSKALVKISNLDEEKLPHTKEAGSIIGSVSPQVAEELNLPANLPIVIGAHDQYVNAVGCGVIDEGQAMLGMGTFICATPVFSSRCDPSLMIPRGVNTEHHAIPKRYVSFICNQGGSVVKWFRDTFADYEHQLAIQTDEDIYQHLFSGIPEEPSSIVILPYFSTTGLPDFNPNTFGVISGLRLDTQRGDILKGIIEGVIYDLKMSIDSLADNGIEIRGFTAVGGGSKSDVWIQVCADILNRPMIRPRTTESGALGSAIIAGVGSGLFSDFKSGVEAMVKIEKTFSPNIKKHEKNEKHFEKYIKLQQLLGVYLKELSEERNG